MNQIPSKIIFRIRYKSTNFVQEHWKLNSSRTKSQNKMVPTQWNVHCSDKKNKAGCLWQCLSINTEVQTPAILLRFRHSTYFLKWLSQNKRKNSDSHFINVVGASLQLPACWRPGSWPCSWVAQWCPRERSGSSPANTRIYEWVPVKESVQKGTVQRAWRRVSLYSSLL